MGLRWHGSTTAARAGSTAKNVGTARVCMIGRVARWQATAAAVFQVWVGGQYSEPWLAGQQAEHPCCNCCEERPCKKAVQQEGLSSRCRPPSSGSAHGVDPAEGVGVPLLLQARQLVIQLQRHGAGLARLAKLAPLALVGEGSHRGDNHGGAGGEDLRSGAGREGRCS